MTNKKRRLKIASIRFMLIVLAATFLMVFSIGKSYSAPEAEVNQVTIEQKPTKKVEENMIENTKPSKTQKEVVEKSTEKVVYLTFDDGPSKLTDQFLDVLKEHDVNATFFMQGSNLKKEHLQESVKRAIKEGHYVGGHSMTHVFKTLYTDEQFVPEMNETLALIYEITGIHPNLIRPPYGSVPGLNSEKLRDQIAESSIKVWDWTIDSKDWALKDNPNQIVENIKRETKSNVEVVLMHEKLQTLEALPAIITFYREKGYEFAVYNDADHFSLNFQEDPRL